MDKDKALEIAVLVFALAVMITLNSFWPLSPLNLWYRLDRLEQRVGDLEMICNPGRD